MVVELSYNLASSYAFLDILEFIVKSFFPLNLIFSPRLFIQLLFFITDYYFSHCYLKWLNTTRFRTSLSTKLTVSANGDMISDETTWSWEIWENNTPTYRGLL